jgi:hypothetical protein
MWQFIKTLASAIYRHTVGGLVRLCRHTCAAQVDEEDKRYVGRLVLHTGFFICAWLFPAATAILLTLRIMAFGDILTIVSNIYQQTANAYT